MNGKMNGSAHGITAENIVVFKCFLHEVPISLFFKLIISISFLFFPQENDWKKKQNNVSSRNQELLTQ